MTARFSFSRSFAALFAVAAGAALLGASCAGAPSTAGIPVIDEVDFDSFDGAWYEIARIPIPVARDWVGTTDTYVRDGTYRGSPSWTVLYEGRAGGFDGKKSVLKQKLRIPDPARPAEMQASPFPLVWLPYRLVHWDRASDFLLVTSGTYDYLWIMAKDPVPPEADYAAAVAKAKELGFDAARLERVPQREE